MAGSGLKLSCQRVLGGSSWVLLFPLLLCSAWGIRCPKSQYPLGSQKCCDKCPAGTELAKRCQGSTPTICDPCESGYYNEEYTESRCKACSVCRKDRGTQEVRQCRPDSNTKCGCLPGYEPGGEFSVDEKRCKPCSHGHFSGGGDRKCRPWTDCAARGKKQKHPGTNEGDVICYDDKDSASTPSTPVTIHSRPASWKTSPSAKLVLTALIPRSTTELEEDPRDRPQSQGLLIGMVLLLLTAGPALVLLLWRARNLWREKRCRAFPVVPEDKRNSYRIPVQEEQTHCKSTFAQN